VIQANGSLAVLGALSADTIRARKFVGAGYDSGIGLLFHILPGPVGNVSTAETTLTDTQFVIPANTLLDGQGFRISGWGTIANNANTKTLRVYLDSTATTILSNATGVANNIFTFNLMIIRSEEGSTNARMFGYITKDAASGAAPTLAHFGVGIGSAVNWANNVTFKMTAQSNTATNDLQLYAMHVQWLR
jgi:hypothetical protein